MASSRPLQVLVNSNRLGERVVVIPGKVEEVTLSEQVDIIISEPMGYMLFNERMLESYLHAKKFLKPNGEKAVLGACGEFPSFCYACFFFFLMARSLGAFQVKCSQPSVTSTWPPLQMSSYTWSSSPRPTSGKYSASRVVVGGTSHPKLLKLSGVGTFYQPMSSRLLPLGLVALGLAKTYYVSPLSGLQVPALLPWC